MSNYNFKKINDVRREDDQYYEGCFWIIANTFEDIIKNKFNIEYSKYLVNYEGTPSSDISRKDKVHQTIWNNSLKYKYDGKDYTYYPRGRVTVYNGKTYINITPKINLPYVIDKIFEIYDLDRFNKSSEIEIIDEDTKHYQFELK